MRYMYTVDYAILVNGNFTTMQERVWSWWGNLGYEEFEAWCRLRGVLLMDWEVSACELSNDSDSGA